MKKLYIITDAWDQTNGVVTTLTNTARILKDEHDCNVTFITYKNFKVKIRLPFYKEITLAIPSYFEIKKLMQQIFEDDARLHIATEGPIGLSARLVATKMGIAFTTSYHTNFPEYIKQRFSIPLWLSYAFLKWFHRPAKNVLVTNLDMKARLLRRGFKNLIVWSRGVDVETFNYDHNSKRDIDFIYVGRISSEKNISRFLYDVVQLQRTFCNFLNVTIVGDGPQLDEYRKTFAAHEFIKFVGEKRGTELVNYYNRAKIKVFPSKTDTFGLVILESLSCGTPVIAYDTTGPSEVIVDGIHGKLVSLETETLTGALLYGIVYLNNTQTRQICHDYVKQNYSWKNCTNIFYENVINDE